MERWFTGRNVEPGYSLASCSASSQKVTTFSYRTKTASDCYNGSVDGNVITRFQLEVVDPLPDEQWRLPETVVTLQRVVPYRIETSLRRQEQCEEPRHGHPN
jgi:hypothetical protein